MHKVLVVEDESDIAQLVKLHLEDIPCEVQLAADGALGLAEAQASAFDLIILDIKLPGLDGLEVCRRLRANGRYTPILRSRCGLIERSDQGVNLMVEGAIRQGKALSSLAGTSAHEVCLAPHGTVASSAFVRSIERLGEERLKSFSTHDFLALD